MAEDMASIARENDFVEQPPEECFCPVSFAVLLEPYQTRCCGNHISQEAYQRLQGQPCPVCREENLTAMKDKFHKRKVMSLKVRCPHKAEGCEWEGELGSLEQHLNTNSSAGGRDCLHVYVVCPYFCNERVQRRCLEEHKSQHCPLRAFTCQYCNHEATYQEVTKEHWPVCEKYPLPCPNECGEEERERQHLKKHLKQTCPLEVIQCEFSYAGCGAQLQRHLMSAHVKEGMEAHLSLVAQVSKKVPEFEKIVQQQGDQIKQLVEQDRVQINQQGDQIKQLVDQIKQDRVQIKQQGDQIEQQGDQIKQQADQIETLMMFNKLVVPPLDIVMDKFRKRRRSDNDWYSPPFYSHLGGYKMCLNVCANGYGEVKGTHVSVFVCLMKGEFDDDLKWPFSGKITIQLKGMLKNEPKKVQKTLTLGNDNVLHRPTTEELNSSGLGYDIISHRDLYAGNYLMNDKVVFCIGVTVL